MMAQFATWGMVQLSTLPGFPLWEKAVHDQLAANYEGLLSIFKAYAANSLEGAGGHTSMDIDEFRRLSRVTCRFVRIKLMASTWCEPEPCLTVRVTKRIDSKVND